MTILGLNIFALLRHCFAAAKEKRLYLTCFDQELSEMQVQRPRDAFCSTLDVTLLATFMTYSKLPKKKKQKKKEITNDRSCRRETRECENLLLNHT
jgi:hypothetical protein